MLARMCARDRPTWFTPGPTRPRTLVATTTCSRGRSNDFSAAPTSRSDSPSEYTSAVSMKLTPASNAVAINASASFSPTWPIAW